MACMFGLGSVSAMPIPIAYYSFNPVGKGVVEVISGEAVILPSSASLRADGVSGSCLELKHQDDSVVSLGKKFGFTGDFSLFFWLRTAYGYKEGEAVVLSKHQAGSYNGYFVLLNSAWGYGVTDKLTFYYCNASIVSKTNINDGCWHSIGIVYRKDTGAELYMDGKLEARGPSNPIAMSNVDFVLGGLTWDKAHGSFAGSLDELSLFDQALGSQDFATLSADPGLLSKQFMKGGTPLDFFGGSISSGSSASSASGSIRIVLKDGRVLTIPFPDIDRIEFVK